MSQFDPVGMSAPVASGTVIRNKRFVSFNTTSGAAKGSVVEVSSAAAKNALGVVRNGSANGETRTLRVDLLAKGGTLEVVAGGDVAVGDLITTDNQGRGVEANTGQYFFGVARTAASSGNDFEMTVVPGGVA